MPSRPPIQADIKAIPYEHTEPAKPPVPITVAPPTSQSLGVHPLDRPKHSPDSSPPLVKTRSKRQDDVRRDSGLTTSTSTARESHTTLATDADTVVSGKKSPSLLRVAGHDESISLSPKSKRKLTGRQAREAASKKASLKIPEVPFLGITTDIPSSSFEDLTSPNTVQFSKRGSMLIGGKKANQPSTEADGNIRGNGGRRLVAATQNSPAIVLPIRVLSDDEEMLSKKVRLMYESGTDQQESLRAHQPSTGSDTIQEETTATHESPNADAEANGDATLKKNPAAKDLQPSQSGALDARPISMIQREDNEIAGGIEDWGDLNGGDVDRYGFITPTKITPDSTDPNSESTPETSPRPNRLRRVSTALQLASESPRRQRSTLGRSPSAKGSTRSTSAATPTRKQSQRVSRPPSSQGSYQSTIGGRNLRIRAATNRLPHNRDRRCMDEAGDMLTLPPGLSDIAENESGAAASDELKRKEWDREEKWRKMAKQTKRSRNGGGMVFEFDTKSPKLIERTWKGIPDKWRATAWHAFLNTSAKKTPGSLSDEELVRTFYSLIDQSSPDDVQIDIDVPRTINSHIMFRRRYRGGQRLLFRVLHCLSIFFPDTGYVQGMATLASTLLCYYDEEMTFVMLVRLWQLRGLDRLYRSGFEGLMEALEEFEKQWLAGGEVGTKLVSGFLLCPRRLEADTGIGRAWNLSYSLWHSLVSYALQLLNTFSCSTPCLGCLYASWRW